eukprot:3199026-Rhodomonas_salina.1
MPMRLCLLPTYAACPPYLLYGAWGCTGNVTRYNGHPAGGGGKENDTGRTASGGGGKAAGNVQTAGGNVTQQGSNGGPLPGS